MKRFFQPLRDFCRGEYRRFVFMTAAAFLVIALLAYLAGRFAPTLCDTVIGYFMDMIDSSAVMDDAGNFSAVGLFFNNLRAMVMTVLYGFIPFLFLPALSLGVNAIIVGVMAAYYSNSGISMLAFFAGILPHGVFELPALILSLAAGLYLCQSINTYIRHNEKGVMKPLLLDLLRLVALVVLPLLIVAAVMEAYVTPAVMQLFL